MKLSNENIAAISKKLKNFFARMNIIKKDELRMCFLIEESLLRFQEKFGENTEVVFVTKKWLGTPKISIKVKSKPYNPIEDYSEEQIFSEQIMKNLLNYEQATVIYRYENGFNEISAVFSREIKKIKIPGGSGTISIFLAILTAFFAREIFSAETQKVIVEHVATPILNTLLSALIGANIPLIFISIIASISSIEDVAMLHELGTKILKRFLIIMFAVAFLSIFVGEIFFPVIKFKFGGDFLAENSDELGKFFDLILSIMPQNIVEPFLTGNILQIVVLALIFGIIITILGSRVAGFKNFIMDARQIIFKLMELIMKLVPVIIFLCIFKIILSGSSAQILTVWKIVAAEYILFLAIPFAMLFYVKIKFGIKILDFLRKIYPAFMLSFTTGSGSASMAKNIEICKKDLKIDENLCNFYIPLTHVLCPTSQIIGIVTCVFFAAEYSGVQISLAQVIILAFLSIQFSLSAISGNGGMLATLGVLFNQLEISLDAIGPISLTDIFLVNISGVVALIIRDCDLVDFSRKVKF